MELRVSGNAEAASREAAQFIAAEARAAVAARGRFLLAFSGGKSPQQMLLALGQERVPWENVEVFQVDERVAPLGHPDRNMTLLTQCLLDHVPLRLEHVHPMPVEEKDLEAAAASYARTLQQIAGNAGQCVPPATAGTGQTKPGGPDALPFIAGSTPALDLVHLGIGPDGHTASLVPGDPALEVKDRDVAVTGIYQERRRMTLTFPMLNRSRRILWLVLEPKKAGVLERLRAGDQTIPAGRIRQDRAVVMADEATARRPG